VESRHGGFTGSTLCAVNQKSDLPEGVGAAFRVDAAIEAGVSRSRLRAKDLAAPYRGVRVSGELATVADRARAYAPLLREGQYFSHTTAAVLLRMRMPTGFREAVLHVTSVRPRRAPRVEGVVGHSIDVPPDLVRNGEVYASAPIDTWIACGSLLSISDLVVMGDGLLARKSPRASRDLLERAIAISAGQRGSKKLRNALLMMRAGTDSAPETLLRLLLTGAGLPEPEVNGEVATGVGTFHGDLVFRDARVVVEYDGEQHRTDDRQFSIDVDRHDAMMAADWRVIRVDKHLLARRSELVRRVTAALRVAK